MSEKVNLEILCEVEISQNKKMKLMDLIYKIKSEEEPRFASAEGKWIIKGVYSENINEGLIKQIEDFEVTVFVIKNGVRQRIGNLFKT